MRWVQQGWLGLNVAAFGGLGAWALVAPEGFLPSVGLALSGPGAHAEVRAMYGGLELGIAGLLAWEGTRPGGLRRAIRASAVLLGALGAARALGMLAAPGDVGAMPTLLAFEVCGCIGGLWLSVASAEV